MDYAKRDIIMQRALEAVSDTARQADVVRMSIGQLVQMIYKIEAITNTALKELERMPAS